jgi:hypothetical protein
MGNIAPQHRAAIREGRKMGTRRRKEEEFDDRRTSP